MVDPYGEEDPWVDLEVLEVPVVVHVHWWTFWTLVSLRDSLVFLDYVS